MLVVTLKLCPDPGFPAADLRRDTVNRSFVSALLLLLCLVSGPLQGFAQISPSSAVTDYVLRDRFSVQVVAGALFSPVIQPESRPDLNYVQTNIRFIWGMDPDRTVRKLDWKGSLDCILELTNSFIFEGAGNVISGVTGLLRYNFHSRAEKWFPYIQAGVGFVYTDAYKDRSQDLIGQAVEFNPQMSLGLRYRIHRAWTLDCEAMFHHISNAGLSERNVGVNALGGFIGVTRFFKGF